MNVAALPDPAQPTFVLLAAGLGAFALAMYLALLVLDLAS
jgi:hypothetical protein